MSDYEAFLASKRRTAPATGLTGYSRLHPSLKPFQADITRWALKRGRAAVFAGTGLGKSRMQVSWADRVYAATKRDVLILAPLAVAPQTVGEGVKTAIQVTHVREPEDVRPGINITNYDRRHKFDPSAFGAVVLDESGCIKSFTSKTLADLLRDFRDTPFKLACSATPAPNDYTELGNHAEFLGVCSRVEMLSEFFVHDGGDTQTWRLKGHARGAFWRWVASWAALVSHPEDLGYRDPEYNLPPLRIHEHVIKADASTAAAGGVLFVEEAAGLMERRQARKASIGARLGACVAMLKESGLCPSLKQKSSDERDTWPKILPSELPNKRLTEIATKSNSQPTGAPGFSSTGTDTTRSASQNTPPTRNSASVLGLRQENGSGSIQTRSEPNTSANTAGSHKINTTKCSPPKAEGAPSAAGPKTQEAATSDFMLTTATPPARSAVSFAETAITGSDDSGTMSDDSPAQSNTSTEAFLIWCDLNAEQDALEEELGAATFSVRGANTTDEKEASIEGWIARERPGMVSKSSIMGWGLNLQFCRVMLFVGVTDSFEAYFQAVRRCWRFGQTHPVDVHIFASEVEGSVVANLKRKERDADEMAKQLSVETAAVVRAEVRGLVRETNAYEPTVPMTVPGWLRTEES